MRCDGWNRSEPVKSVWSVWGHPQLHVFLNTSSTLTLTARTSVSVPFIHFYRTNHVVTTAGLPLATPHPHQDRRNEQKQQKQRQRERAPSASFSHSLLPPHSFFFFLVPPKPKFTTFFFLDALNHIRGTKSLVISYGCVSSNVSVVQSTHLPSLLLLLAPL